MGTMPAAAMGFSDRGWRAGGDGIGKGLMTLFLGIGEGFEEEEPGDDDIGTLGLLAGPGDGTGPNAAGSIRYRDELVLELGVGAPPLEGVDPSCVPNLLSRSPKGLL